MIKVSTCYNRKYFFSLKQKMKVKNESGPENKGLDRNV